MTLDEIAATALGAAHKGKSPEEVVKLSERLAKSICKRHGHQGLLQGGSLWICKRCRVQYFVMGNGQAKTKRKRERK